uniref:Uncharacterized protein n=1 Tax=Salmonella phage vB_SEnST11_KE15 TaxID=3161169 RepID=A0AAU8GEL0_9CAUD
MITLACRMTFAAVIAGITSATSARTRGYRPRCSM